MTVDEAKMCCEAGADCIVVSNHGGRVLDGCPGGADVLPEIAYAWTADPHPGGRLRAQRRGRLKLMALGANGVLVGRPLCWGATAAQPGRGHGAANLYPAALPGYDHDRLSRPCQH